MGPDAMILVFWRLSFKPTFSLSSFTFIKRIFSSSLLSAISVVSSAWTWKLKSLSPVGLFATLWTVAYQAPLSMGFSQQEYWSRLPFPSPGDHFHLQGIFPIQGSNPGLPHCMQMLICISEVIDISPCNVDSSLCLIQPSVSHDVLCIQLQEYTVYSEG